MSKVYSGSAVARHHLFVLADGSFVVQWDSARVQDLLSGRYQPFDYNDFGHAITDYELNQLKAAGRVEHYNQNYVWLFSLPETGRFDALKTQDRMRNRVRTYYLNTTLPAEQMGNVQTTLTSLGLGQELMLRSRGGLIALLGKNGAPFPQLRDAETVQKQLLTRAPELFKNTAVAFIETSQTDSSYRQQVERSAEVSDLATLIASQTDTTMTKGKKVVLAGNEEDQRQAIRTLLDEMKLDIKVAATASEAMQLLEDCQPELLVMDLKLPDMHGWTMLAKVREIGSLRQLLTIAIADHGASSDDQAFALTVAKVEAYLVKPVSMAKLRQSVWLALKNRAASA